MIPSSMRTLLYNSIERLQHEYGLIESMIMKKTGSEMKIVVVFLLLLLLFIIMRILRLVCGRLCRGSGMYTLYRAIVPKSMERVRVPVKVLDTTMQYGIAEFKGMREYMEDRNIVISNVYGNKDISIYAVFDGHGGEFASQYCIDNLKYVLNKYKMDDVVKDKEKMMVDLFKALDEELLEEADKKKSYAGTTALMMIVNGKQITIANAGDSRGILVHKSGSIMLLSQDHKPDRKDERSRITKLGGLIIHWGVWRVEGLLAVSRALFVFCCVSFYINLIYHCDIDDVFTDAMYSCCYYCRGDSPLKKYVIPDPECVSHTVSKNDLFVVLATDGIWDVISNEEAGMMLSDMKECVYFLFLFLFSSISFLIVLNIYMK